MATHDLTPNAEDDLERIYDDGFEQWGEAAADRDHRALFSRYRSLTERDP
jgi:plasmid stabilization system protein ParE